MPGCVPTSCPACKLACWRIPGEQKTKKNRLGVFLASAKAARAWPPPEMSVPNCECVSEGTDPAAPGAPCSPGICSSPLCSLNCVGGGARWKAATSAQSVTKIRALHSPLELCPSQDTGMGMEGGKEDDGAVEEPEAEHSSSQW